MQSKDPFFRVGQIGRIREFQLCLVQRENSLKSR
jgi:hypothetical protein